MRRQVWLHPRVVPGTGGEVEAGTWRKRSSMPGGVLGRADEAVSPLTPRGWRDFPVEAQFGQAPGG